MKQEQWLKTRRHLLDSVKSQVKLRLGPSPRSLKTYSSQLDKQFQRSWESSEFKYLIQACRGASWLFLGDFHAYYQSQRAHLRILRNLDLSETVVFLECLRQSDERWIRLFWKNKITEAEFLKKTQWSEVWGFPWEHYRDLILHLKANRVLVKGLTTTPFLDQRLKLRDRMMAKVISSEFKSRPFRKAVVVVGEKHLYKNHLPLFIKKSLGEVFKNEVCIFQDNEDLYFRTHKKYKVGEVDVLRQQNNFCWNVSPPWVKWQSYLMHLEQTWDQELEEDCDYEDHIKAFVQWMGHDLGIRVSYNNLEVITPRYQRDLDTQIPSLVIKELIASERSFLLNARGKIYLSRPSVNHGAAMAGQYIHNQLSHRRKVFYKFPDDLERRIWVEAVGFFFSKWMNPSRKAESFEGFQIRLHSLDSKKIGPETMKLVSDLFIHGQKIKRGMRSKVKKTKGKHLISQLEACRFLGRIYGKAIFEALLSRRVSKRELMDWLNLPLEQKEFPKTFWEKIVPRLI